MQETQKGNTSGFVSKAWVLFVRAAVSRPNCRFFSVFSMHRTNSQTRKYYPLTGNTTCKGASKQAGDTRVTNDGR
jgi:hypothetical protein